MSRCAAVVRARVAMGSLVGVLSGVSAGCPVVAVPAGVEIRCASTAECPETHVCRESLSRCIPKDDIDGKPPKIVSREGPTPAVVGVGGEVAIVFEVDVALLDPPLVHVGERDDDRRMALDDDASDAGDRRWAFRYRATGAEPEEDVSVEVTLVDSAGDEAAGLAAGSVRFDFTPPTFTSAPSFSRDTARADGDVTIAFVLDEDPAATDPVTSTPAGLFAVDAVDGRAVTLRLVPGAADEGAVSVRVTARDLAGNASAATPVGTLTLDDTPPSVAEAPVPLGPLRPGDVVALALRFDEPLAVDPTAVLEGAPALPLTASGAGRDFAFSALLPDDAGDGVRVLRVSGIEDRAGNAGDDVTVSVAIDGTPPAFAGPPLLSSSRAGASAPMTLTFAVDNGGEALPADPVVVAESGAELLAFTREPDADGAYVFRTVTPASTSATFFDVSVRMTDAAGNTAQLLAGVFEIDTTPPDAQVTPSAPGYKAGDVVRLVLAANEPLLAPPALVLAAGGAQLALSVSPAEGGSLSYTYTHIVDDDDEDGTYTLAPFDLADLAGNAAPVTSAVSISVDGTAPSFAAGPTLLDAGPFNALDDVVVTFTLDAAVTQAPVVALGTTPALVFSCPRADGVNWTCTLDLDADLPDEEGAVPLSIEVQDDAQNRLLVGLTTVLDFTPPTLVTSLSPPDVRVGATIILRVVADEPLADVPTLTGTAAGFFLAPTSSTSSTATWVRVVENLADGTYDVAAAAVDEAGNASLPVPPEELTRFSLDSTPPSIVDLRAETSQGDARTRFSRVTGYQLDAIVMEVAELDAVVTVALGDESLVCDRPDPQGATVECPFDDATVAGGAYPVLATASDAAGNLTSDSLVVVFDFTAPGLLGTPAFSRSDGFPPAQIAGNALLVSEQRADAFTPLLVRFAFVVDEAVAGAPSLGVNGDGTGTALESSAGTAFVFTFDPQGPEPEGTPVNVTATVSDDVGNAVALTLGQLTFDRTLPTLTLAQVDTLLLRRMPWGDTAPGAATPAATLSIPAAVSTALEDGAVLYVTDGPGIFTSTRLASMPESTPVSSLTVSGLPFAVFVAAQDRAGNWPPVALEVKEHEWVATFGGKVAGSLAQNPHEIDRTYWATTVLRPDEMNGALSTADYAALAVDDGVRHSAATRSVTADWTQLGTEPSRRRHAAMVYDPQRQEIVLYGGEDAENSVCSADTDCTGGERCVELNLTPSVRAIDCRLPCTALPGCPCVQVTELRGTSTVVPTCEELVVLDDTWIFDGVTWTTAAPGGNEPQPRAGHAMAYDPVGSRIVLSGGHEYELDNRTKDATQELVGTWDGVAWSATVIVDSPCDERQTGWAMAFDGTRVIRRGGTAQETCLYVGTPSSDWTRDVTPVGPPARSDLTATLFPPSGRVILYGGSSGGTNTAEVWSWDPAGTSWGSAAVHTATTARSQHAAAYDPVRGRVVFVGGLCGAAGTSSCSLAEWDGSTVASRGVINNAVGPVGRFGLAAAYYEPYDMLVVAGGADRTLRFPLNESWVLRDSQNRRPALDARFAFAPAQTALATVTAVTVSVIAAGFGQATNGVGVNGAQIVAYDHGVGRWLELDDNTAALGSPALVEGLRTGAGAQALLDPDTLELFVRLQPDAPQGPDNTPLASVEVDSVRVAVRYRRL